MRANIEKLASFADILQKMERILDFLSIQVNFEFFKGQIQILHQKIHKKSGIGHASSTKTYYFFEKLFFAGFCRLSKIAINYVNSKVFIMSKLIYFPRVNFFAKLVIASVICLDYYNIKYKKIYLGGFLQF